MHVELGKNSYDILLETGILDHCGAHLTDVLTGRKTLILSDTNVAPLYLARVKTSLEASGFSVESAILPAGEATKSLSSLAVVYTALSRARLTRSDALIALGGGVIGDLGGFAAATYLRGIAFVQIPTSLLAQVDSSVGGKVAVDLPEGKNLAGAFYQPRRVLIDPDVLKTLTDAYFRDGMGEVIKYGCIRSKALFEQVAAAGSRADIQRAAPQIIEECLDIKRRMVEEDEHDTAIRMLLNFGHTLGHAIETAQHYAGYSHGEAVAAGMCLITHISEEKGFTPAGTAAQIEACVRRYRLPVSAPAGLLNDMRAALGHDKKNLGQTLYTVLLRSLGEAVLFPTDARYFAEVETWLQ